MLTMDNVTVTFQDGQERLTALDNISFSATPGHLTFIVGESGSGKSTLLSAPPACSRPTRAQCLSTTRPWTPASASKKSA